jgi:hypothetical protein
MQCREKMEEGAMQYYNEITNGHGADMNIIKLIMLVRE